MRRQVVTLALQGGGSHGAFTWGVLDRLLEDGCINIEGISGASAGAMNAVVLAHGYTQGGTDGAREALSKFWESVSTRESFNVMPAEWGAVELKSSGSDPAAKQRSSPPKQPSIGRRDPVAAVFTGDEKGVDRRDHSPIRF
jgi:predicted acylesterase/phospholipase RssA